MAKIKAVTIFANKTQMAQAPLVVMPDGTKTIINIQAGSRVKMQPGTVLDNNWAVLNANRIVVFENQPFAHGWEIDDGTGAGSTVDDEDSDDTAGDK